MHFLHHTATPNEELGEVVPRSILALNPNHSRYVIAVEKSTQRLFVYEADGEGGIRVKQIYNCTTGQAVKADETEGSRRSP